MTAWFVSDIHLKDVNERNGNTLLRFLFFLNKNPKENQLYFLGDIFDFWLSGGAAFANHYKVLVDEIEKFKKGGGFVCYFEGNHDFHVDVFWTKKLGIPVYENEAFFNIDGFEVRAEHGDLLNPDDLKYLKYRALVRHAWIEPIGHIVPGFFWKWLGEAQSQKSRKTSANYGLVNAEKVRNLIRTHAHRVFKQKPFDLIVTGHMHICDEYTFEENGKVVKSVNLGTWLEKPRALRLENGKADLLDLDQIL
ncbi:MAG: UDP-2,3-diacylglucosamine diphosphatase [Bdellovibrio sp.]|nr:UDP-2,3-diacylglucosamine diphosphatase [Bdellovibrio sp.]